MSYYAMERGWQDHEFFEGEKYSRRDAWEWLIANACWKETKKRIRGHLITLKRGQLSHSIRFLSEKWRWAQTNVHRFLHELKSEAMIGIETEHDQNIITICNYDKYQAPLKHGWNESGTKTGTELEQSWNKEEEGKEGKEKKEGRFAFSGIVIRLNQRDFDLWKGSFHAIPDLVAELTALDAWYAQNGSDNWFIRASQSLKAAHKKNLALKKHAIGAKGRQWG